MDCADVSDAEWERVTRINLTAHGPHAIGAYMSNIRRISDADEQAAAIVTHVDGLQTACYTGADVTWCVTSI